MSPRPNPTRPRPHPLMRSPMGLGGLVFLGIIVVACIGTLPWTLGSAPDIGGGETASPRYDFQVRTARQVPPTWAMHESETSAADSAAASASSRLADTARLFALTRIARERSRAGDPSTVAGLERDGVTPTPAQLASAKPIYLMGTDLLGRDLLTRCLAGGGISITIGVAAALLSVILGTTYGALAGYIGGRVDDVLMRIVDVLYGLPTILLIVLFAVAVDSGVERWQTHRATLAREARAAFVQADLEARPPSERDNPSVRAAASDRATAAFGAGEVGIATTNAIGLITLLVAIGGVSWLTMARVVRGQVLSLKAQPFVEAARAIGVSTPRLFVRHLLPNLLGPIVVYATLTVPQAILQESFLSFLGIGVRSPLPSWGNLAADGLAELNPFRSHWWLLLFPCVLLGSTLLALNFIGEGLREALDPRTARR